MVCCVFQATNLVNNYGQRKSARTFVSRQEASNKLYTVLAHVFISSQLFCFIWNYHSNIRMFVNGMNVPLLLIIKK